MFIFVFFSINKDNKFILYHLSSHSKKMLSIMKAHGPGANRRARVCAVMKKLWKIYYLP